MNQEEEGKENEEGKWREIEQRGMGKWRERKGLSKWKNIRVYPIYTTHLNRPVLPPWTEPVLNPAALGPAAVQSPILFCHFLHTPHLLPAPPSISFLAIFMHFKFPLHFTFFYVVIYQHPHIYFYVSLFLSLSFALI